LELSRLSRLSAYSKYIRNLNSWRKVLKSGTKGTNGTKRTQMFLSGRFNYLNRIDFSLELSRLFQLSAYSKIYQKFEFLEKSFKIRDKRDNGTKRTQMFLSGRFNYLNRIDFSLEFSRLFRLSAFSKKYQKFEFLEKSFKIRDKRDKQRDKRDKLSYL
jgi:hypothetical protein